jgi:phage FluMu protein gp41
MTTIEIQLQDGLAIGGSIQKLIELCQPSAGDLMDARRAAEKLVYTEHGPMLLVSPNLADMEVLCRQILRADGHEGPLSMNDLRSLSGRDLARLLCAAQPSSGGPGWLAGRCLWPRLAPYFEPIHHALLS